MALRRFVDDVVTRLEATPVDLSLLAPEAVSGSIFTGAAGVAFFLHEVARLRGDDGALPLARAWLAAAQGSCEQATRTHWGDMDGVVTGESGIAYVALLLAAREGNTAGVLAAARILEKSATVRPTEILGGAAGVACAIRDLESRLPAGAGHEEARGVLAGVRERETERVLAKCARPTAHDSYDNLGFAHGVAGELWALASLVGVRHDTVRARLAELDAAKEEDDEGLVYWPTHRGKAANLDLIDTWCNGMAGHTLLWTEVARQRGDSESTELATRCAESTAILLSANSTLCCGLAGHAVALERYAAVSGDKRFKRRASDRLRMATQSAAGDRPPPFLSLWQGTLGIALVAMRRRAGERGFPCIEPVT